MKRVDQIAQAHLCLGCGACAYICPEDKIELRNLETYGIRPSVESSPCGQCTECIDVCPAHKVDISESEARPHIIKDVFPSFGPILEIWEGYATDEEIRFKGSSGGALTALALHCIKNEGMDGVLHIGQDPENALSNKTKFSTTREQLLENAGSRYAPASACDSLDIIEKAENPCVFIGQPSEVSALRKAQKLRPNLDKKTGLALSFFCAGTPSTKGTKDLVEKMKVPIPSLKNLRYRGYGWPGMFSTQSGDDENYTEQIPYRDTWRYLQHYRPFATHLCPDGSGEDADISCGDPWYKDKKTDEKGFSLIVVRTEKGRQILKNAADKGIITMRPADTEKLIKSQGYLIRKRGAVWGRLIGLKLLGRPTPILKGFHLLHNWNRLSLKERLRSVIGTIQRVISRKLYRKLEVK